MVSAQRGVDQSLDGRVVGEVHEEHDAARARRSPRTCCMKNEASRWVMPIAPNTMANSSPADDLRLPDDLRGELVGGQTRAGEDRELLPADQRVQAVDRGDAGLDEVGRVARGRYGLMGAPLTSRSLLGDDGRPAVDRLAGAVEDPAEQLGRNAELDDLARGSGRAWRRRRGPWVPEDLDDRQVPLTSITWPLRSLPSAEHLDHLVVRDAVDVLHEDERTRDVVQRPVLDGEQRAIERGFRRHLQHLDSGDLFVDLLCEVSGIRVERRLVRHLLSRRYLVTARAAA